MKTLTEVQIEKREDFYYYHEIRRPLANLLSIINLLNMDNTKPSDEALLIRLIRQSILEFDEAIKQYK